MRADFSVTVSDGVQFAAEIGKIMQMAVIATDAFSLGDISVIAEPTIPGAATGLMTISFSTKVAQINFTIKKPEITFH